MSDYISVGERQFLQMLTAPSCIFMSELYFSSSSSILLNPRSHRHESLQRCKYKLRDIINCSPTWAAQAVLGHQANMAADREFALWWLHDASLTESRTSSQTEHTSCMVHMRILWRKAAVNTKEHLCRLNALTG